MFDSVEALCRELELDPSLTRDEMIRELKRRIVLVHPDKSEGTNDIEADAIELARLTDALNYLRNRGASQLVPASAEQFRALSTEVTNVLSMVEQLRLERSSVENATKDVKKTITRSHRMPQVTAAMLASICVAIVGFSEKISHNPILGPMLKTGPGLLCVLSTLVVSGIAFLVISFNEFRLKSIGEFLQSDDGLECVAFWRVNDGPNDKPKLEMTKREIVTDILDIGGRQYSGSKASLFFKNLVRVRVPHSFAEQMSEILLSRLLERGLIVKIGFRGVEPLYAIEPDRALDVMKHKSHHTPYSPRLWSS